MRRVLVLSIFLVGIIADGSTTETPEVTAPVGKIRGSTTPSRLGKTIYSYRGVRYGKPPTHVYRFQVARPVDDWTDVFDATQEGPACPGFSGTDISEDCLRLNVYTTTSPSESGKAKKPVLVFFHPGGFYAFSGQSFNFGPQYLLDKNLVLVTVNYRLGIFGFLSTGDNLAPGNLAFKDQVVALRWVKRNIAAFGGDPDNVTISGHSAGSLSVMLHMLSPMSKGLFHRVIAMSGSVTRGEPAVVIPHDQKELAKKQAQLLNCTTDYTTGTMMLCMLSRPVKDYMATMDKFFEWHGFPILVFKPVIEPEARYVERFLDADPIDLIRQGKFHHVPLILGITNDEFGGISAEFEKDYQTGNGSMYRDLNDNWNKLAPMSFLYERDTPRSNNISQELRKFYFGDKPISSETRQGLANIYADATTIFPVYRAAKLFAQYSSQPVYLYKFTYQGRKSFVMWNDTTPYGVVHHDDLQYLYYWKSKFPYIDTQAPEAPMLEISTSIWESFVNSGQPIPANNNALKNVHWDRLVPEKVNYLELNLHPTMKTGIYPERMQEWERLFPLTSRRPNE